METVWRPNNLSKFHIGSLFTLIGAILIYCSNSALAEKTSHISDSMPWTKSCADFIGPKDFVKQSTIYCLKRQNQRLCDGEAEKFFEACHFKGDFERMSQRISARMLVVIALASTKPSGASVLGTS